MNTLDRLIELCNRATPGPWACENEFEVKTQVEQSDGDRPSFPTIAICTIKYRGDTYELSDTFASANAEFISAANPDTVKRLCELVKECKEWILRHHEMPGYSELLLKLEQLEKGNTNESSS